MEQREDAGVGVTCEQPSTYGMDWLCGLFSFVSQWMIAEKWRSGWLVKLGAIALSLAVAVKLETYGFIPVALGGFIVALRGYSKWT